MLNLIVIEIKENTIADLIFEQALFYKGKTLIQSE